MRKPRTIVPALELPSHSFHSRTPANHTSNPVPPDIKVRDNGLQMPLLHTNLKFIFHSHFLLVFATCSIVAFALLHELTVFL